MDHIPRPYNSPWEHVETLFYTHEGRSYDYSGPWATFPVRQDYHIDSELYVHSTDEDIYPEHLKPQLAAFVQSWLYFGVISEFFESRLLLSNWTEEVHGRGASSYKRVCTKSLLPRLDLWCQQVRATSMKVRSATVRRVDKLLHAAGLEFGFLSMSLKDLSNPRDLLPWTLVLSIDILLATLTLARNSAAEDSGSREHVSGMYTTFYDRIRRDGGCPSQIQRLKMDCSHIISEYCASLLGPVHHKLDHASCTPESCAAFQIDHEKYRTRHITSGCLCNNSVDVKDIIANELRTGEIPVIRLNSKNTGIEIATASTVSRYTAISHVWSDGLGNLESNSLPLCQLHRIQGQVDATYVRSRRSPEHMHFWIDTICVPVGDGVVAERNIAIARMKEVYVDAEIVLVLNAELNTIPSDRDEWELSARINRTPWFRRLWTLHEGVLARRLLFQLKDCAVDMSDLQEKLQIKAREPSVSQQIHQLIFSQVSAPYFTMEVFKCLPVLQRSQEIWSTVHSRSTSNAEDETICLCNMLDLNLTPILAISRADPDACNKRMQEFILQQRNFPQATLFYAAEDHEKHLNLRQPGFRWAPRSFVFRQGSQGLLRALHDSRLAPADDLGLHVSLPGVEAGTSWQDFFRRIHVSNELFEEAGNLDPILAHRMPEVLFSVPDQWDVYYSISWTPGISWSLTDELLKNSKPAIILPENLIAIDIDDRQSYHDGHRIRDFPFDAPDSADFGDLLVSKRICHALLVARIAETEKRAITESPSELYVTPVASILLTKALFNRSTEPAWKQLWFRSAAQAHKKFDHFSALPDTTMWCVG